MSNLTVVIDDELLRTARIKALQQGTSVNEICRQAIERFAASGDDSQDFMAELIAISNRVSRSIPKELRGVPLPSRNEMMEEAMAERMPTLYASLKRK
jgi:hypothetical protein